MPTSHATAQLVGTASKCELVIERALVVGSPRLRVFLISWAKFSAWPAALQVVRRSPVGPGSHLPADRTTCAVTSHAPTDPTRPSSSASAAHHARAVWHAAARARALVSRDSISPTMRLAGRRRRLVGTGRRDPAWRGHRSGPVV